MTMQKPPARTPVVPASPASGPSGAIRRAPAPAGTLTRVPGPTDTIRLNKRMAERGLCSRREADDWIAKGWVKVNGQVATMGLQVKPTDRIEIDKKAEGQQATQVTILLNKPMGFVSGQAEDGHEPAVTLFTAQNRWRDDNARFFFHPSQLRGLAPAGRLDIDSIGLLVLTQDGRVARQLIGEDSVMEKEYLVRVSYLGTGEPLRGADERPGALRTIHENDPVTTNVQAVFPPAHAGALAPRPLPGRPAAQAGPGGLAEPRAAALRADRRQETPDPPHVRTGGPEGGRPQARAHRPRDAGQPAVGQWRYLAPHERF
jgi:23S rRNA pseudouridine2604 synthase